MKTRTTLELDDMERDWAPKGPGKKETFDMAVSWQMGMKRYVI